jgi:hypothetical protein
MSDLTTYAAGSCPGVLFNDTDFAHLVGTFPREGMALGLSGSFSFSKNASLLNVSTVESILHYSPEHVDEVWFYYDCVMKGEKLKSFSSLVDGCYCVFPFAGSSRVLLHIP